MTAMSAADAGATPAITIAAKPTEAAKNFFMRYPLFSIHARDDVHGCVQIPCIPRWSVICVAIEARNRMATLKCIHFALKRALFLAAAAAIFIVFSTIREPDMDL